MTKAFKQVDVFTSTKYKGNPVAVFFDADDLTPDEMQQIANWTNLSETTFVCKPTIEGADYQVKIYTTTSQLPFAGHPTIGTCYSLLELGLITPNSEGKVYQECEAGLVELTVENYTPGDLSNTFITFQLPYYRFTPITVPNSQVETLLGVPQGSIVSTPVLIDDGPRWATFELASGEIVKNANPDFAGLDQLCIKNNWQGVGIFGNYENSNQYELRNFFEMFEDPACGSGSGAVGAFLTAHAKRDDINIISISQGCRLKRDAKINVLIKRTTDASPTIFVGGNAITCINGTY